MKRRKNGSKTMIVMDLNTVGVLLTLLCAGLWAKQQWSSYQQAKTGMESLSRDMATVKNTLISLDKRVAGLEGKLPQGLLTQGLAGGMIDTTTRGGSPPGGLEP
jgi:hypothetical protein